MQKPNFYYLSLHFAGIALFVTSIFSSGLFSQNLLIENAHIVDPASQKTSQGHLLIKEGIIVDQLTDLPAEFEGARIDASGKYVIPGLNDMHVHSFGNMAPGNQMEMLLTGNASKRMLYCGVTGFLDLFSEENSILALRDQQRKSGFPGADIYCAGPILTCTGGHGTEYGVPTRVVNTPEEAVAQVDELAAKKPDVIKIVYDNAPNRMPTIDKATLAAIISTAKKHQIKTVTHIGTWQDVIDVIHAGGHAVTHTPTDPMPEEVISLMKENNTFIIPTLAVQSELLHLPGNDELLNSPLLAGATESRMIEAYRDPDNLEGRFKGFLMYQKASQNTIKEAIHRLVEAEVAVMAGTDAGNPGTFQGYSLHRELVLMVENGVSTWEALEAATTLAGKFLNVPLGVSKGDLANLVILNASPIEDISNTQDIYQVIHHGKVVDRDALKVGNKKVEKSTTEKNFSSALNKSSLDDFEANDGLRWSGMTDSFQGGKSTIDMKVTEGVARISGVLKTGDRSPFAWAGMSAYLDKSNKAQDISVFKGIRLKIKINTGSVYLSMMAAEVKNFDYHMAILPEGTGEWQEVELPFSTFRQNFSAQIPWTGKQVLGINIGASGTAGDFSFEVDQIELY